MQVVNTLGAKLLQGERATLHGLIDILRERWEIVWFASHGSDKGIYLSDGPLNASEITSLIRAAGVRLTVFNTCESYELAHAIHRELNTDMVCTVKKLPDRSAYITGVLFAQQIAQGMDFYDAYEVAKPGQNSTYTFLGAKGQVMPAYERPNPRGDRSQSDADPMTRLHEIVEQLDAIVFGSTRYNLPGLVKSNESLILKIDKLAMDVAQLQVNQLVNRRWVIALTVICSLLLVGVVALWYMQGGGN
jgi:hypothetical protein